MSLYSVHLLSEDNDFRTRCIAAAALRAHPTPFEWALAARHLLAASPGFGDKYESALVGGVADPGRDQAVIADDEIVAAVARLMESTGGA
jgi:hypothetical protein